MSSSSSIRRQRPRKLKEEMYLRDFKTRWLFKAFQHIKLKMLESKVQLDHRREANHQLRVQIEEVLRISREYLFEIK